VKSWEWQTQMVHGVALLGGKLGMELWIKHGPVQSFAMGRPVGRHMSGQLPRTRLPGQSETLCALLSAKINYSMQDAVALFKR
jgi:hypothetical protein